jgi:hypothetical protein
MTLISSGASLQAHGATVEQNKHSPIVSVLIAAGIAFRSFLAFIVRCFSNLSQIWETLRKYTH